MKRLLALICSVFAVIGTAQYVSTSANQVTTLETTDVTTITTTTTYDPVIYQKVAELFTSVNDIQALVDMLNERLDGMDISVSENNDKITNLDGSVVDMFAQLSDMQNAEPVMMNNQSSGGNSGGTNLRSNSSDEKAETTTATSKIVVKEEETTTTKVTTETTPTETTVSADTDGNASLLEDTYFGENRQFITVTTKDGNVFYILIDKGAGDENNVYFLNKVDVADLNALLAEGENGTQIVTTAVISKNEDEGDGSVTTTVKNTSQQKKATKSNKTLYIFLGVGIPLFVVAYYFIKIRPKKSKKGFSEDFDFEEEQDERYEKDENEEDEE